MSETTAFAFRETAQPASPPRAAPAGVAAEARDYVMARINYLVPGGPKPVAYQFEPPPGIPVRSGRYAEYPVVVRNARAIAARLSLDREGFAFLRHSGTALDFDDADAVKAAYYPEIESEVKAATGAARVLVFDHTVRHGDADRRGEKGGREPVKRAHNDYTVKSGPRRVRDLLGPEAAALLERRFAIVNFWRPIVGPVEESPLALCDAHSIAPGDLVATDLVYRDRIGEVYSLAHAPAHRWYYFPRMERDEAVFIKCFDSAADGRARFAAHSAFDDPTTAPGAAPRHSIELRTLAFFA